MRHVFLRLAMLLVLSLGDTACKRSNARQVRIILTGSSTVAPLASALAKRFEAMHPGVRVDVQSGGSSRGIADIRQKVSNIGMVSRKLKKSEQDLHSFTIARDGISVILNQKNTIKTLTQKQIVNIYTGQLTNWKQVGGKDAQITVINKAAGRSTLELFLHHFKLSNKQIKAHVIIGDNEQGIKTVAGNPNAIGYVSIGAAIYNTKHGVSIKLLPLQKVAASLDNVRKGTFPLARPLNLVTQKTPTGFVKKFILFARSTKVHDIVRQQYFVPLAP